MANKINFKRFENYDDLETEIVKFTEDLINQKRVSWEDIKISQYNEVHAVIYWITYSRNTQL